METQMTTLSAGIRLFLIMDPLGNIPLFLALLKDVPPQRRRKVMIRELLIALGVLIAFLLGGQFILKLLQLRHEEAQLLEYANFAEVSLVPKMAESPQHVVEFLEDLAKRARPFAEKDLEELRAFARDELGIIDLQSWDVAYASEKLREQRYAFSEKEVKEYFPEPKVVQGLFTVIQELFNVQIKADQAPVWHPDVRFFRIERDGQLVGQFYLDLYAREGKNQGAWMDDARGRRLTTGGIVQTPAQSPLEWARHDTVLTGRQLAVVGLRPPVQNPQQAVVVEVTAV